MAKKESKLPGDKGSSIKDVVKEEMDPEGLPVIDRTEKSEERGAKSENIKIAVRIMAVKTYLQHPSGIYKAHFQNELITDPWPELLELAKLDREGRTLRIVIANS